MVVEQTNTYRRMVPYIPTYHTSLRSTHISHLIIRPGPHHPVRDPSGGRRKENSPAQCYKDRPCRETTDRPHGDAILAADPPTPARSPPSTRTVTHTSTNKSLFSVPTSELPIRKRQPRVRFPRKLEGLTATLLEPRLWYTKTSPSNNKRQLPFVNHRLFFCCVFFRATVWEYGREAEGRDQRRQPGRATTK
jgi:hypothetical protein